uniref:G domain-containing protein n=1 Tax=Quercus lobata TaxID=97700 RepID=A0A7N2R774_QUELO
MYQKLLELVEFKLKEVISREHTLLIFMIGVSNIAKSVLINSIRQIASSCFPGEDEVCYCHPTAWCYSRYFWIQGEEILCFMIAHQPSIYVLETPGVLVPSIPDIETELKLALAGSLGQLGVSYTVSKWSNLDNFQPTNVRRLVRRPSSIPSKTHFRFTHLHIHKDRRELKQPTAFSDKQAVKFANCAAGKWIWKLLDYVIK